MKICADVRAGNPRRGNEECWITSCNAAGLAAAELMVEEYADGYGLRYIVNRCGLLAGPWQMGKTDQGVMALWMGAHYFRHDLAYIGFQGTGKQVRDVLHIDDFCDLVVEQIRHFPLYGGRLYNVGGGLG